MSKESASSSEMGLLGWLAILFIGLKLTHFIDWSWWWVLAPLWGPVAIIGGILAITGVLFLIATIIDAVRPKRRTRARVVRDIEAAMRRVK